MKQIVVLPSFERSLKKFNPFDKKKIIQALERFNEFLTSGHLLVGLGLKKINHDKYEFRVDIRLRVILKTEGNIFYLVFVGNHDDVRKYLRDYR